MRRFALRALLLLSLPTILFVLGCSGGHSPTEATGDSSTVTYTVTNSCSSGSEILIRFFDDQDLASWPDPFDSDTLSAGKTSTFALNPVSPGTQTCYGAQTSPDPTGIFWGVGLLDNFECADCCSTVPASGTANYTVTLTPSSAIGCEVSIRPAGGPRLTHQPATMKTASQAPPQAVVPHAAPATPIPRRDR
jgi:hypothetical protein